MRRFAFLLFTLFIALLVACSNNEKEDTAKDGGKEDKPKEESKEGNVEVDKGLLNVEITLPASMFEGQDLDTVIAEAKKEGVKEVTKNEDGSLTYKMSKGKHQEMLKEIKASIDESLADMKTSGDYVSIKDVTYNDSLSEFTLEVDQAAYENSMDGFATMTVGMSGMMYQLYNGVDPENYKVTIFVKDQATQNVFNEIVYPDDLNEQESEAESQ